MKICKNIKSSYNYYNDQKLKRQILSTNAYSFKDFTSLLLFTMADDVTTQQTQGQQQWQHQWYSDDILGWENIFATIPEAESEVEDELAYGDMLEKKYQFEPIPEIEPVAQPVQAQQPVQVPPVRQEPQVSQQAPTVPVPPVQMPVPPVAQPVPEASVVQDIAQKEIQEIQQQASLEQVKVENLLDTKLQTDIQKKFGELFFTTKKIYELRNIEDSFDIVWANNDKVFISYRFLLDENESIVFITKIEQDKETEEETVNELSFGFNEENSSVEIMVNDALIFDEIRDLTEDQKKKMQVVDKLNKFIFLASEELKKIEKEIKEKEEAEKERKRLQEIFRNF